MLRQNFFRNYDRFDLSIQMINESVYGKTALEEKLMTEEQASKIHPAFLKHVLSVNGLIALREKLITPELLAERVNMRFGDQYRHGPYALCSALHVAALLTDDGIFALRNNLVQPKEEAITYGSTRFLQEINQRVATAISQTNKQIHNLLKRNVSF